MRISDWSSDVCSSDLDSRPPCACRPDGGALRVLGQKSAREGVLAGRGGQRRGHKRAHLGAAAAKRFGQDTAVVFPGPARGRSEEHTSELQSLMRISYAVFCLKKKKTTTHLTGEPDSTH